MIYMWMWDFFDDGEDEDGTWKERESQRYY